MELTTFILWVGFVVAVQSFLVSDHSVTEEKANENQLDRLVKDLDNMKFILDRLTNAFEATRGTMSSSHEGHCPDGWKQWENHCYYYSLVRKNWVDAENACERFGGHLVTIDSADEGGFIENYIMSSKTLSSDWTRNYTWIGAFDFLQEGNWLWVTGRPVNISQYINWRPEGPNNAHHGLHDEDCMDWSFGSWNDNNCFESFSYVCEKSR